MKAPMIWAGGLIGSIAAHGVAFAFLNISVEPDPTPTQPKPKTQLSMDAYQVDRQDAPAQDATGEAASETEAQSTDLTQGAIPQTRSDAQIPQAAQLADTAPQAQNLAPSQSSEPAIAAQQPDANRLPQTVSLPTNVVASQAITINRITESKQSVQLATALVAPTEIIQQAALTQPRTTPVSPQAQPVDQVPTDIEKTAPLRPPSPNAAPQLPNAQTATQTNPQNTPAPSLEAPSAQADQPPLPTEFATASLAFNFGDRVVSDPTAIATIQAFMAPQAIDGSEQVRDELSALLSSIDCARLSATYIPETGALELRGHVPDNALRAPVLKALQDQIGEGITVTDNLLHLPKPQCGALTGIANVGLAQSTDQFTNKRLIGDNAQAVEYTYSEGQPLAFDLTAPDYDAVVYVDYFDADGQVIHLVPNEVVGLQAYTAKEVVGIERGDGPKLNITIGPPFGQEIAVAFAASRPLYSGVRPLVEPAAPYLEFLKAQVANARELDPEFKGEWVYFFITTQPATQ